MSELIPAISLWQPWASLWISGVKIHETRDWSYPSKYDGVRIAVHAAKKRIPNGQLGDDLHKLCLRLWGPTYFARLPFGAVIGTIELGGSVKGAAPRDDDDAVSGFFGPERYAWLGRHPLAFDEPIPTIGRQGFFEFDHRLAYA